MDSPEARTPSGAPWLFSVQGLAVAAFAMALAATFGAVDITFLAGALVLVGLAARGWAALAFVGLSYSRRTTTSRAFRGDEVGLESTLNNPRLLPLPWLEVWEQLPAALEPQGTQERSFNDVSRVWVNRGITVWPYQRQRWRRRLRCTRRGVYRLGAVRLRCGDPLGLIEREYACEDHVELMVYPRVVPLRGLALPIRHPSLDVVSPRSPVSDPTRTATVRDYRPDDAQRLIHWPTTARRGSLQVRVLEPATSLHVSLLLDVRGFTLGVYGMELLELTLSALASMAVLMQQQGSPFALLANTEPPLAIAPGASVGHLQHVLESLARLQSHGGPALMPWALSRLPPGSSVVLATSDAAIDLPETLSQLERSGFAAQLVLATATESWAARPPRANALVLTPDCDLAARLEGRG